MYGNMIRITSICNWRTVEYQICIHIYIELIYCRFAKFKTKSNRIKEFKQLYYR